MSPSAKSAEVLGKSAKELLAYKCKGITKDQIHAPSPTFIDDVYSATDRNPQVLGSLVVSLCLAPAVLIVSVFAVRWGRRVLTDERQDHWLAKMLARSRVFAKLTKWAAGA